MLGVIVAIVGVVFICISDIDKDDFSAYVGLGLVFLSSYLGAKGV